MDRQSARREARLRFGSVVTASEIHRDVRSLRWIERLGPEIRFAWRAVRARGWQAVLALVLLGVALAANTIVFSAADAFVFRRTPYPSADRLVAMGPVDRAYQLGTSVSTPVVVEWRRHQDVFAAVHARFPGGEVYFGTEHATEPVQAIRVTPGLLELLGARPRWGRLLQAGDAEIGAPRVAVIGEDIALRVYGDARSAVGQRIQAGTDDVEIVGVVPAAFRYPTARERLWRPLSLVRNNPETPVNMGNIALLAPGVSFEQATFAVAQRGDAVKGASRRRSEALTLHRFADLQGETRYRGILLMLTAAAACLLLIACANVASLELAAGFARSRAMAVHAALGASVQQLLRMRLIETAMLVTASAGAAWLLARGGAQIVASTLPAAMAEQLSNAIDIDERAIVFMLAIAAFAWAMTLGPTVWRASRVELMEVLRNEARLQAPRRGAWARHALVVSQVAATVILLVGALLYTRSYAAKVAVPKGFDSTNLITVTAFGPPASSLRAEPLREAVGEVLTRHPAIASVVRADRLMPVTGYGMMGPLNLDKTPSGLTVSVHGFPVAPEYFRMLRIPIVSGSVFGASDPMSGVIVDEALAREFWPGQDPIGKRFGIEGHGIGRSRTDMAYEFEVIGVAGGVRQDRTVLAGVGVFIFYYPVHPQGGSASFIARLRDGEQLAAVAGAVRAVAPQAVVKAELMADRYARLEGDLRLAAGATGSLAALAVIVAALGIYAVMAFIVSGRTREIGIRMALGAGVRDIRREVFAVSMRFVVVGVMIGVAIAFAATRWIESQLYGVSATNPATYAAVAAGVFLVAAAATWRPAVAAARVDPAIALRNQ